MPWRHTANFAALKGPFTIPDGVRRTETSLGARCAVPFDPLYPWRVVHPGIARHRNGA